MAKFYKNTAWGKISDNQQLISYQKGRYNNYTTISYLKDSSSVIIKKPGQLVKFLVGGNSTKQVIPKIIKTSPSIKKLTKQEAKKTFMDYLNENPN